MYVELGKPRGISESTIRDPCFDRFGNLQIQPVEPFQPVPGNASAVDAAESFENLRDRLRISLDTGQERSIVRKLGPL